MVRGNAENVRFKNVHLNLALKILANSTHSINIYYMPSICQGILKIQINKTMIYFCMRKAGYKKARAFLTSIL